MKTFNRVKTSQTFVDHLISKGIPENKIKKTISLLHWLVCAQKYNEENNKTSIKNGVHIFEVSRKALKSRLRDDYPAIIDMLWIAGYIEKSDSYSNLEGASFCKSYGPTEKLIDELGKYQEVYLDNLIYNNELFAMQDKAQKKNRKILATHKFADSVLKNEFENQVEIDWKTNYPLLYETFRRLPKNKAFINRAHIITLMEGEIKKSRARSEKTGRIYNPLNNISGCIRKHAIIKGKPFALDLDMRACHLSLLADYFYEIDPSPQMLKERGEWRELFSQTTEHPREFLARQLNMKSDNIKKIFNSWINGKEFKGFENYLRCEFPCIYKIYYWKTLREGRKQFGNNISRTLESAIFRSEWVIEMQETFNVATISTHDGLMIYGGESNAGAFADAFIEKAQEVAGWKIYFTLKRDHEINLNVSDEIQRLDERIDKATSRENIQRVAELMRQKDDYINQIKGIDENELKIA